MINENPSKKACPLYLLDVFAFVSIIGAVLNGANYTLGLIDAFGKNFLDSWKLITVYAYGLVFSLLIILVEMRYKHIMKFFPGFKNWALRGLFMIFVGILPLSLPNLSFDYFEDNKINEVSEIVRDSLSYALIGIGVIYFIGEITCVRRKMQSLKGKNIEDGRFFSSTV